MPNDAKIAGTADGDTDLDLPPGMFRAGDAQETVDIGMFRTKFGVQYVPVTYAIVDGAAIYEGDIVLGTVEEVRGAGDPGAKGLGISPIIGDEFRWPGGVVPYAIAAEAVRGRAEGAVAHWQERTPFRFVQRTDQEDFISFEAGNGCSSLVGRRGGKQVISLAAGCTLGAAIHEIGHALGFFHEQGRSDRDQFIEVVTENIIPEFRRQFDKHILDADDLGPYDFDSIMHYPATAFSANGQPTIRTLDGKPIGQRNGLSAGDVASIRIMYPDLAWPD